MPKAQNPNWAGYWEPTPRNQAAAISRADRVTAVYDREVAFRQSQRDALIITPRDGEQRGQKREADFSTDDDSDCDIFHTPKAMCMKLDDEDEIETLDIGILAEYSDAETEQQQENENIASQTPPIRGELLDIQKLLATMEDKMQSLDKTTEKHVGDINHLLPRVTKLTGAGQAAMKKVDMLAKSLVIVNNNTAGLMEAQEACSAVNREVLSLCGAMLGLVEQTRAAQVENRAAISSLQRELSEIRSGGSTRRAFILSRGHGG
ncbi:hypothetical protein N0V84_011781 [Fusarium piperis]|uniref:Uncharacterized protein n=1 Tax=Fusarium piperis TaxID=1435070 RepID=A0A9W8W384_9HYPO|nr:hypothetical protein N0V84_011781 [Fusarium piperis]